MMKSSHCVANTYVELVVLVLHSDTGPSRRLHAHVLL